MAVKEVRPHLDPESCSICGRRLLQGEQVNFYVAPDSSRRVVCELCVPRAERVRWAREREGEEIVVNFAPELDAIDFLKTAKREHPKTALHTVLGWKLPRALACSG